MNLSNQIALITGGSSGIGKACANKLKEQGAKVVIWDTQIQSVNDAFVALALCCDVSSAADVEAAIAQTIAKVGIPRICINCAGIAPAKLMVTKSGPMPLFEFEQVIAVNLTGSFNVMRVVAEALSKLDLEPSSQERGVIINTASIAAFEGQIGQLAYSASKGGIVSMTLPAARELARYAIRVNTIAPGLIKTPMLSVMPAEVQQSLEASCVFPKRLGKPEEFADLACHIIENPLINGSVIRLDGAVRLQAR